MHQFVQLFSELGRWHSFFPQKLLIQSMFNVNKKQQTLRLPIRGPQIWYLFQTEFVHPPNSPKRLVLCGLDGKEGTEFKVIRPHKSSKGFTASWGILVLSWGAPLGWHLAPGKVAWLFEQVKGAKSWGSSYSPERTKYSNATSLNHFLHQPICL